MSALRRLVVAGAAVAVALVISGCAADEPRPATSRPSDSASATPTGASSPSSSPSPSTSAQPGITAESIGGIALGGSVIAAGKRLGASAEAACPWVLSAHGEWTTWVLADPNLAEPTDEIALLAIDSTTGDPRPAGSPTTASGIGLGSTLAQVRAAYPSAKDVEAANADFAVRYTQGDGSIVFEGRDDVVQSIKVLPANADNPSEFCG